MPKERPPTAARAAAQLALRFRHRREPVIYEVAEEEIGPDRAGQVTKLAWRFAGEGWQVTLSLQPVAAGWTGTLAIEGEPDFDVTVYRGDGVHGHRSGRRGTTHLGFLEPGPLSLTCALPNGRAVQTEWLTLPGAHARPR